MLKIIGVESFRSYGCWRAILCKWLSPSVQLNSVISFVPWRVFQNYGLLSDNKWYIFERMLSYLVILELVLYLKWSFESSFFSCFLYVLDCRFLKWVFLQFMMSSVPKFFLQSESVYVLRSIMRHFYQELGTKNKMYITAKIDKDFLFSR